jgi:NAD(P)-dependent dehydrogenase (short-subunit alcohol dehydrogenase family)
MSQPTLIITGASRGLGAAAARAAAQWGANLVLAARSAGALQALENELDLPANVLVVAADIGREEDCRAIVRRALDSFDRIDGLVNNAGLIEPLARIADAGLREWERNWQVNLLAPLILTQLALPALRLSAGRVINVGSGAASDILPGWSAYSTAKAALEHLTRILAAEEPQITALNLRPGVVDTPMQAEIRARGRGVMAPANYEHLAGLHQQGRLTPPEAPGRAIARLALSAPHEWSGQTVRWNEDRVKALVAE